MEKVSIKQRLGKEPIAPLIEDQELAMRTFFEKLERGESLYPDHGTEQGFPRV